MQCKRITRYISDRTYFILYLEIETMFVMRWFPNTILQYL